MKNPTQPKYNNFNKKTNFESAKNELVEKLTKLSDKNDLYFYVTIP